MIHEGVQPYTRELSEMHQRIRELRVKARADMNISSDDRMDIYFDLSAVEDCIIDQLTHW